MQCDSGELRHRVLRGPSPNLTTAVEHAEDLEGLDEKDMTTRHILYGSGE